MATDFIIDMETLGKDDKSVILSIGVLAVPEEPVYDLIELVRHGYYAKLNRDQQIKAGRTADKETIEWWKNQGKSALDVFANTNLKDICQAQLEIRAFVFENGYSKKDSRIWSRGMIDQRWWQSLCKTCQEINSDINDFLPFWIWRDTRTALELLTGDPNCASMVNESLMIKHHALYDCAADCIKLQGALNG